MAAAKGLGGKGKIISQLLMGTKFLLKRGRVLEKYGADGAQHCECTPGHWTEHLKTYWNGKLYVMYSLPQLKQ